MQPIDDTANRTGQAAPDATAAGPQERGEHQLGAAEPQTYVALIEWNVEAVSPREAAEAMRDNVRLSEGPVVELTEQDGQRIRILVDLEREPGDGDLTVLSPPPDGILITRQQLDEWAGRPLLDDELDRLRGALPHSSIPDAIGTIVDGFAAAPSPDTESPAHRS